MMRSAAGFDCAFKNSDELAHINIDKATVKKALVRRRVVFIRLWSSVEGSSSEFELLNLCDRLRYRIIQLVESDPTRGYGFTASTEPQPRRIAKLPSDVLFREPSCPSWFMVFRLTHFPLTRVS